MVIYDSWYSQGWSASWSFHYTMSLKCRSMPILTAILSIRMTRAQSSTVQCWCCFAYYNWCFLSSFLRKGRHLATLWLYPSFHRAFRTVFSDVLRLRSRIKWWRGVQCVFELARTYISMCHLSCSVNLVGQPLRGRVGRYLMRYGT